MIVLSGALVLVALVLLVFGAVDRNLPYVYASIGVSVLSLLLLLVGILQRRGELTGDDQDAATTPVTDTSAEREPALVGAEQAREGQGDAGSSDTQVLAPVPAPPPAPVAEAPQPALRRVEQDAPSRSDEDDVEDLAGEDVDDEPEEDAFEDDEPDDDAFEDDEPVGSGVTVLVVSGRPRYHLEGCRVLRGKEPQALDRDDARTHGFSPCGVCKPDADEVEPAAAGDESSFTEALFGERLFADEGSEPGDLPDRPVPAPDEQQPAPPAELQGDDPADDPALVLDDDASPSPAPDLEADPDGAAAEPADVAVQSPTDDAGAAVPVLEPAAGGPDVQPADDGAVDSLQFEEPPAQETGQDLPDSPDSVADVDGPAADDVMPVEDAAVAEPAPARTRSTSRTAPAVDAELAAAAAAAATAPESQTAVDEPSPAGTSPVRKAPAKKSPAKKAPVSKAPATKAPAKKPPAKKAPAAQAPAAPTTPHVKRPVVRAVRADALRLGAPSSGVSTTRVSARAAAPAAGASVVVVPDRDRFHRPECRFVRGVAGATTLPKASAARQGYAACGVCKP